LPSAEINGCALVLDEGGFGGENFKVAGYAAFVAVVRQIEGVLG
jgi:hypothetical protein